ncbi:dihydropteroate synthase [Azomonas macrocytogenes]|uniref:Dihydropteroate synthase n=1 Tax=Azomonas macrocytogenes TaxID=69962 RepID=A0A839T710_AZOMA|nr:dihydropteroate synthase [Azomonas macrocytogenes]MBB3104044.1 dihydropteroate synthase [Azomonas macrocytogenes]
MDLTLASGTRLPCGSRVLDLSHPHVMGILNVTPDSFSDGGRFTDLAVALSHAEAMVKAGATLIDVGGESTRPGAEPVSSLEELERVAPVIEAISSELDVIVSVDTSTPSVIREAARLGAGLINDVRALTRDGALAAAMQSGLPVCLMHMNGEPRVMQQSPCYENVLEDVQDFLSERIQTCIQAGMDKSRILIDPGFGFGKSLAHNLTLFKHMQELHSLGCPLLVGVSRKGMIGQVLAKEVDERLYGSLALAAVAVFNGAHILRVHDVAETVDVVRMIAAVKQA